MIARDSTVEAAAIDAGGLGAVRGSAELRPGDVVGGKYLLLHKLGAGGMGQVWMARNSWTGAEVAVKALLAELASSGDALARLRSEAHATAILSHRGIVRIFDLVELAPEAGSLLIVMELLRGHTLAQRLESLGPLSVDETLALALPILSALSHAHGRGVVHRDVKPDNVFLALEADQQVVPKLVDFGISQLREWSSVNPSDGVALGTPWYMSPEQARGEEVDARCDVFGVGVLLYECLTGTNPFRGKGTAGIAYRRPVPLGAIPVGLRSVITTALAERPQDRFASAAELAEALLAVTLARSARRSLSSRPGVRAACGLALTLLAALFAYQSGAHAVEAREPDHAHEILAARAAKSVVSGREVLMAVAPSSPPVPAARARRSRSKIAPAIRVSQCVEQPRASELRSARNTTGKRPSMLPPPPSPGPRRASAPSG